MSLRGQKGMTLIEVIVALPVAALIAAGVAGTYYQIVTTRPYVDDSLSAYQELQQAGNWFGRDTLQAQHVDDADIADESTLQLAVPQEAGIVGVEVLSVRWTNWDDDVVQVVYSLVSIPGSALTELRRTVRTNGSITSSFVVATHCDASIDPTTLLNMTRVEWSSEDKDVVRLVITVVFGRESVTRMYEVRPRAAA